MSEALPDSQPKGKAQREVIDGNRTNHARAWWAATATSRLPESGGRTSILNATHLLGELSHCMTGMRVSIVRTCVMQSRRWWLRGMFTCTLIYRYIILFATSSLDFLPHNLG